MSIPNPPSDCVRVLNRGILTQIHMKSHFSVDLRTKRKTRKKLLWPQKTSKDFEDIHKTRHLCLFSIIGCSSARAVHSSASTKKCLKKSS